MPLFLDTGTATNAIQLGPDVEQSLVVIPDRNDEKSHGTLVAVAEGASEKPEPNEAARDALQALHKSYYACPEGWRPERGLAESFDQSNRAVLSDGAHGRAASLSALVLRQRRWWIAHAGSARVWLLRDKRLKLLTKDHVALQVGGRRQVTRACGLGPTLSPDVFTGEIAEDDVFILATSGMHEALDAARILSCLLVDAPASQLAKSLIARALVSTAKGTFSACVVRVEKLPPETAADMAENLTTLPAITPPAPGGTIDGYRIGELLHKSRYFRLYLATDQESGSDVVIKFPNPRYAREPDFADGFLREEWIAKRIACPYLAPTLPVRSGRRNSLYMVMAHEPGEILSERIKRKRSLPMPEALDYAEQLLTALEALHRHGVVHGNVRAKDILVTRQSRQLRLLALGSSHVDTLSSITRRPDQTKTSVTHLAPELFVGGAPSWRSDVYATGVTLYHMLTGHYPYGHITNRDEPPSGDMAPASRYRQDIPPWLDAVLSRACALDPSTRYASATEFSEALAAKADPKKVVFQAHAGAESLSARRAHQPWEWFAVGGLLVVFIAYLMFALR